MIDVGQRCWGLPPPFRGVRPPPPLEVLCHEVQIVAQIPPPPPQTSLTTASSPFHYWY